MRLAVPLILLVASVSSAAAAAPCPVPVVETSSGALCGAEVAGGAPGGDRQLLAAYLGVPYAKAPVGNLRWAAPAAADQAASTVRSSRFGPSCPQNTPEGVQVKTSEDCLTLNVWTPDVKSETKLPVLVFLYGGSFLHGGTAAPVYDGANLAAVGKMVIVTVNYRIGALGFLAGLDDVDGNYGLLDQQLALRWVRDNIESFGGDPARVTLMGQSAGAMSVGIHLGAASSRDLFRAAIMESNPYGIPYKTPSQARRYAETLAVHLGCDGEESERLQCLRGKPVADVLAAQKKLPILESFLLGLASFVPWGPVMGVPPLEAAPNDLKMDKPVLLGTNRNEGVLFVAMQEQSIGMIGEAKYVLETDIAYGKHGEAIRTLYKSLGTEDPVAALSQIVTDDLFVCANRRVLMRATAPIWGYQFAHAPSFAVWPEYALCAPETGAVCHGAELPFVFGNPFGPDLWARAGTFTPAEE